VTAPEPWRFEARTRDELAALAPDATVVVPLGSTEQHGHHLPVCVDTALVEAIARRAGAIACEQVPTLVTPTLAVGFAEHHVPFGGTISLTGATYVAVLTDIGASLARQGFRRLVFLNGHGGNDAALKHVLDRLATERRVDAHLAGASYWELARGALAELGLAPGLVPGHAGHFEISLMLALAPGLVRLDLRPTDDVPATPIGTPEPGGARVHRPGRWEASDGRTDDARRASAELGARVLEDVALHVADFVVAFHRSCG
jgi:creatinine amidohydrolase